jgi:hypothetical protein
VEQALRKVMNVKAFKLDLDNTTRVRNAQVEEILDGLKVA